MKRLFIILFLFHLIFLIGCKTKEQTLEQSMKNEEYATKIEQPSFIFTPLNASPLGGKVINLSTEYHLKVSKDTIEAYLPYYGRAYSAPMGSDESGIKFVSTDFVYKSEKKKDRTYEIIITPKDLTSNMLIGVQLRLHLGTGAYGTLNVQSVNRQTISFYGRVE